MLRNLLSRINPFSKIPRLAVVFVEYERGKAHTADQTFATLQQYLATLKKGCEITYLRVDNTDENRPLTEISNNTYAVGGDNSAHEFSGWQRGIDTLASLQCNYDLALIINDMFLKPGPSFLQDYATPELLKRSLTENKIIGRIDTTGQNYILFDYDVSSWICTNCFLVPKKAANALGNMVLINDNIHQIFPRTYDPRHRIKHEHLSLQAETGNFRVECDIPPGRRHDIRIKFEPPVAISPLSPANDDRPRTAMIKEITHNGQPLPEECRIRGLLHDRRTPWSAQSFLLELPRAEHPSHLVIKGCLPPESHQNLFNNEVEVVLYNDALLYQENAPINTTYQRWIVEWLTERWHSRFEINQSTWNHFKTKAAAIFNEALLTAKFRELGYPPETYGSRNYY